MAAKKHNAVWDLTCQGTNNCLGQIIRAAIQSVTIIKVLDARKVKKSFPDKSGPTLVCALIVLGR